MGAGAFFTVVTFLAGVLLLLGWAYFTTDNPRSGTLIKKSLLFFALPILFAPTGYFQFPLSLWAWVAVEEALKTLAARSEHDRMDRFWLVCLFGIWELTLDKPFWGFLIGQPGEAWDRLSLIGLVYATILPVLMHTVTAAIYAFRFEGRLWLAFLASWIVHTAFNESVDYFGLSVVAACAQTAVLVALLLAALRPRGQLGTPAPQP